MLRSTFVMLVAAWPVLAGASVDIPLSWKTVTVSTEQRGGAEVSISRTEDNHLETLSVTIRGQPVSIPAECLPNGLIVFLNDTKLSYGQYEDAQPYWVLEFGVDYEAAFDNVGRYRIVLLSGRVQRAYIEYAESDTVSVHEPLLCGTWKVTTGPVDGPTEARINAEKER